MSVFDEATVRNLCTVYNKEHPKEAKVSCEKRNIDDVWGEMQKRLSSKCRTGRAECIISSLLRRPRAPAEWNVNREEWLSSDDIDAVEKNYAELFPDYYYVGAVPIDFDLRDETRKCVVSALCSMKLQTLYEKGHRRIGIVVNTDTHDGPGQHWVAVFADLRPELEYPRVTYFDSYAFEPEKEIKDLMQRWKDQWQETGIHKEDMKTTYNKTRHQFKDSECGMYCLYFHYACLMNIPMGERMPDEVVNTFRNLLFRMPPPKDSDSKE